MERVRDLVVYLAKALVDEPEAVDVALVEEDRAVVVELTVAKDDLGKVIGKEGRTARAIRTLVSSLAAKERVRAILDIVE